MRRLVLHRERLVRGDLWPLSVGARWLSPELLGLALAAETLASRVGRADADRILDHRVFGHQGRATRRAAACTRLCPRPASPGGLRAPVSSRLDAAPRSRRLASRAASSPVELSAAGKDGCFSEVPASHSTERDPAATPRRRASQRRRDARVASSVALQIKPARAVADRVRLRHLSFDRVVERRIRLELAREDDRVGGQLVAARRARRIAMPRGVISLVR